MKFDYTIVKYTRPDYRINFLELKANEIEYSLTPSLYLKWKIVKQ